MSKPRITIVGLGLIGNAIGLALGKTKRDFEIVGHDKDNGAAGRAKKLKAVDRTDWNLIGACDGADLVILALPVLAIRDTLQALAGELKPGCVVMDTASVKEPVLRWAAEILPATVDFVGTNPIIRSEASGGDAARADLFERATWAICAGPETSASAIKMAADLAERLGARPLFLEPEEHDGMLAGADHLPVVVSTALLTTLAAAPSWRETRRLAGGQFETSTRLASTDPQVFVDMALTNRENLARWVDEFAAALQQWGALIEMGNEEALRELFAGALDVRARWDHARLTGTWDETEAQMPGKGDFLAQMIGLGGLGRRNRGGEPRS